MRLVFKKRKVWLREARRAEFVEHRESRSEKQIKTFYIMFRSFYNVTRNFYMMIRIFYTMIRSFYWKRLVFKKRKVWLREARRAEFVASK